MESRGSDVRLDIGPLSSSKAFNIKSFAVSSSKTLNNVLCRLLALQLASNSYMLLQGGILQGTASASGGLPLRQSFNSYEPSYGPLPFATLRHTKATLLNLCQVGLLPLTNFNMKLLWE